MRTSKYFMIVAALALTACGKKPDQVSTLSEVDQIADSAEVGLQVASGMLDDQSGGSFALNTTRSSNKYAWLQTLVAPAEASGSCARAVSLACNTTDGTKVASYSDCSVGLLGQYTLNGYVSLDYSANSCSLNVGEEVVRTFDWTIAGPRGRSIQHTSASRSNYLGASISGGGKLAHIGATNWQIDILGKHAIAKNGARSIFDISVKTSAPVLISGGLDRANRVVNSGQIDVYHNLAKFTASFVPNNLTYSSSCCHPVGGSLSVNYSGSVTGSGSIEFNGCGNATLTRNGIAKNIELTYCE